MDQLHSYAKLFAALIVALFSILANAQDPVMSQFTFNKNFLNPAYAGFTKDLNMALQNRAQWTRVPGNFNTTVLNANIGCPDYGIGYGLQLYNQYEGEGFLRTTFAQGQVSMNIPGKMGSQLGRKLYGNNFILSAGLQFGLGQKFVDWGKLEFSDQFDHYEGFLEKPSAVQAQSDNTNIIFDLSAGVRGQLEVGRGGSYISLGLGVFHINEPEETFFGLNNEISRRYSAHFFTYFQLNKFENDPDFLSVGMITSYQSQLSSHTVLIYKDLGDYIKIGLGYRRQEFLNISQQMDALILQGTADLGPFTLGYSYDLTLSSLTPNRTFGTHEFGLTYTFENTFLCQGSKKKKKKECYFDLKESW